MESTRILNDFFEFSKNYRAVLADEPFVVYPGEVVLEDRNLTVWERAFKFLYEANIQNAVGAHVAVKVIRRNPLAVRA